MECPSCKNPYKSSSTNNLPRVLLQCGHTFCHQCISNSLQDESLSCFTCKKISFGQSVENFPVNDSLISFIDINTPRSEPLCKQHQKRIDIFCEKDHKLLCSECIIYSHQNHKMITVSQKAEKERATLNESLAKIKQTLLQYRSSQLRAESDYLEIQHAFLDCQAEANLFFQTIQEQVGRLQKRQIQRLLQKKEEGIKKLLAHKEELSEQIHFFSQVEQIYVELSQLGDAEFLIQDEKRSFIADSSRGKKNKYVPCSLEFKRSSCLQEIAKSIQEMIALENNRLAVTAPINLSPSLKKHKEPAVLEVNLKEEYQKRKGTLPSSKPKPAKKTISIHSEKDKDKQKVVQSLYLRNVSHSFKEQKIDLKFIRENSLKRNKNSDMDSSVLSLSDMNSHFTPLSSVHSFMDSSRNSIISHSQADSFFDDTTLKNTFCEFSAIALDDHIYHIGGLTNCDLQKYHPQTGNSERISGHSQYRRRSFQGAHIKINGKQKCLLIGGISSNKSISADIYQFNFKDEKIIKSAYKLNYPRSSFGCAVKQGEIYIVGGKIHDKALNNFQKYRVEGHQLVHTKLPSMIHARQDFGCCLGFDASLYALGGITSSNDATNSAERFNSDRHSWEIIKPMRYSRISFIAVATPRGIFVIGGHTTKKYLKQVEFFDYQENRWIQKAAMNQARCYHSAVLSKDYQSITVFGGFYENNQLDSIEIYDINSNEWSLCGKMKEKRCLHISVSSHK